MDGNGTYTRAAVDKPNRLHFDGTCTRYIAEGACSAALHWPCRDFFCSSSSVLTLRCDFGVAAGVVDAGQNVSGGMMSKTRRATMALRFEPIGRGTNRDRVLSSRFESIGCDRAPFMLVVPCSCHVKTTTHGQTRRHMPKQQRLFFSLSLYGPFLVF